MGTHCSKIKQHIKYWKNYFYNKLKKLMYEISKLCNVDDTHISPPTSPKTIISTSTNNSTIISINNSKTYFEGSDVKITIRKPCNVDSDIVKPVSIESVSVEPDVTIENNKLETPVVKRAEYDIDWDNIETDDDYIHVTT
jgi:hypothetical protein